MSDSFLSVNKMSDLIIDITWMLCLSYMLGIEAQSETVDCILTTLALQKH